MKKKVNFPKKAKLIADGGFYRIEKIDSFVLKINTYVMRRISISTPELDYSELWKFHLTFSFDRVYKGYAEYRQIDCIKVEIPKQ